MTTLSRSQKVNNEITDLLRARTTLLWIVSREERRVEAALLNSLPPPILLPSKTGGEKIPYPMRIRYWDCVSGLTEDVLDEKTKKSVLTPLTFTPASPYDRSVKAQLTATRVGDPPQTDPQLVLQAIREIDDRCLYVLRDFGAWKDPITLRALRNTLSAIEGVPAVNHRSIVVLTTSSEIPPDLIGDATLIDYPLPDRMEIEKMLDATVAPIPETMKPNPTVREAAIDAALGLSALEIQTCYNRSLVTKKAIDPQLVASEKKRVIARDKLLTWSDPEPRAMKAIGGLENVKEWLIERQSAFTPEARKFGLPSPKGIVLAGIPGTGKSLIPKCIAAQWGVPLLRLDLGALLSKWQGDSQANIRKALNIITTVGRCVVLLDEFEKAIAGSNSDGSGDSGVAADQLGTLLTYLQEREGEAFFVATLNDPSKLPPELLRKGRWDEFFWVDLPSPSERKEILKASLTQYNRTTEGLDVEEIVRQTDKWTGAEIAALIPAALFRAFNDGARALSTADLLTSAKTTVPLSITMGDKLTKIRDFMAGKARPASKPEEIVVEKSTGTLLDLGLD